ncbi:MAG: hypothetical protein LPK26_23265, partial [Bacillaceae bacterium]|nr:hypothetical protein [Bacillaceae bacterium]
AELNENIRVKTIAALAYRQLGKIEKANEIIANIPIEEIETLSVLRELVIYFRDIGEDETAVELAEKALSFNYEAYPFYLYLYELTGEQIYLDQLQILKDIDMQLYGMTPSITDANVTELFPGWLMTEEKELSFGFKDYKILILQQDLGIDHYEAIIKVAVVNYNNRNQKWTRVWESDEFESYIMFYSEDIVENIQMTTPKKTKALFAFDFNFSGGSSGHYENIVFSIDMNGQGHLVWYDENFRGGHMEKENNQISLFHPFGKSIFNVKKGQLIVEHVSRSEMAPEGAIEAFFEIGSLGVVASEDRFLQIPAGSTVAVVPNSEQARQMFDEREIGLYMGWAPVTLAHAYYVYIGNYFTLNEPGIYQIVLTVEDGDLDFGAPEPTFIIEVYEGEEPTQLPAASTERNEDNLFDVTKLQWGMTVDEVQSLYPNDQLTPETMEDMVYFQIAENRYAHTSCVIDDSLYLFFEGGRLNFIQSEMNLIDECNIEGNGNNQQLELGFQELYVEVSNDFESNTLSAQMVAGSRYEQWDGGNSSYSLGFYADMYSETLQPYALFRISKVRDGAVVGR